MKKIINTKVVIVILACIAVSGSLAHAVVSMGSTGVEDVIYAHSSGGYGAIYWQQYDATGANIGNKFICNTPGQDIGIINSITARANSNGNVDMFYLMTNTGWSDVRLQQLDTSGNLVGTTQFLESDSVDGFRKFYTGVDAGKLANGNTALFLSGLDAQGNSTIYMSMYDGNVRQSQSVLKSFTGDISIGDIAISDIEGDGSVELLYATSAGGIAAVNRIDFDTAGNIVSETSNYVTVDLSWGSAFTCKALTIGQADSDAELELLVAMSRPDQGMETFTLAYQLTNPVVYPTTAFSAETLGSGLGGFMWQGVGIVDFSGEVITIPEPATCVYVLGMACWLRIRKSSKRKA